jgi:Na+-driven multidrug efflux pump
MFGADNSVLSFVTGVMAIDVLVELGRGMNHVGQNGLNATGDVRFTTVISILSCWICSVGFAYLFGIVFNFGLYGIWLAFAIDELFRGTLYYLRWKKQGWRKAFSKI